jgi:predicted protein tyrosine phosphatase
MKRVLFVCGANRLRSPTAEQVFGGESGIECLSAGLNHDAENPLTPELVAWADVIFVMEKPQKVKLSTRFREELNGKRVVVLGIPDHFCYMDPALVDLLRRKVTPHLR